MQDGFFENAVASALQNSQVGASENVYKRTLLSLMRSCQAQSAEDGAQTPVPEAMLQTFVRVLDIIYIVEKNQQAAMAQHNAQITSDLEHNIKEFSQLQCAVVDLLHLFPTAEPPKSPLDMCKAVSDGIKEMKEKLSIFDGQKLDDIYQNVVKYTQENELLKRQNRSLAEAIRGRDKELEELSQRLTVADASLVSLQAQSSAQRAELEKRLSESERDGQIVVQEMQENIRALQESLEETRERLSVMETRAKNAETELVDAQAQAEQEKQEFLIEIKLLRQQIGQLCAQLESGRL